MHSLPPPATREERLRPPSAARSRNVVIDVLGGTPEEGARSLPAVASPPGRRDILVCALLQGAAVHTTAPGGDLLPGRLLLIDSAAPAEVSAAAGWSMAVLSVPRAHLPCSEESLSRACLRSHDTTTGTASLLHPLLLALTQTQGALPPARCTAARLRNQLADLVSTLVTEAAESMGPGRAHEGGSDLARRVRDWVNERLGDPALQPGVIAAGNYISVRRLHKLFERQNSTVSVWIQQRRLDECRRELGRSDGRTVKVSTVAQRWGFINAAHFSRAFRARYAVSPRDWREMRASMDGHGPSEVAPTRSGD